MNLAILNYYKTNVNPIFIHACFLFLQIYVLLLYILKYFYRYNIVIQVHITVVRKIRLKVEGTKQFP